MRIAETKNDILVVFAANDTYIPMFGVVLNSLIKHADPNRNYRIVLLEEGIGNGHWKKIMAMQTDNVRVERMDVADAMRSYTIEPHNHLSKETAYRLLIPRLFPDEEKILYLDSDILIRSDIAKLYDLDLEGCILGATIGRLFAWSHEYVTESLGLNPAVYFNAGILLMNLEEFRKRRIGDEGLRMLSEKQYANQDQDVLNIICQMPENVDKVKYLDFRWNFEWQHLNEADKNVYIDEVRKGSLEVQNEAYIIHFTGMKKPWNCPNIELAELFWEEAKETVFYEELLMYGAGNHFNDRLTKAAQAFDMYLFPWSEIKPGENVIIYGGGVVGQAFLEQIRLTQYCSLIAVCDKNAASLRGLPVPAVTPGELPGLPQTHIVIAIDKQKTADAIRDDLVALGIDKEMLIWRNYRRK